VARFDYNPLTNQLDLVDSPAGYINGVVADPTLLPVTLGTPALDSVYLAKAGSGLWLISRKPAGLYCRVANNGNAADWQFLGAFPEVNADGNWALYNSADPTKELKFQLSGLTTATTRTLTVPDASGTLPLLETANTFTQNQTLNGTNNVAPSQTAASGSSVMTRDLVDARFYPWSPAMHGFGSISGVAGGSTALGPWMMASRADSNFNFGWGTNNSPGYGLPFFCNNGKSINTARIQHIAGTHPTAVLEVGIYLANAQGLPDGYVEKVSFPLDATGNKTQTLVSAFTPTGLFWVLIRPSLGDTSFKAGGNGVTLQVRGHVNGHNLWAAGFFGAQKNGDITQFGGTIMPTRAFNNNLLPTSSVAAELELTQTANGAQPTCILY
jgi:hypothetical protein